MFRVLIALAAVAVAYTEEIHSLRGDGPQVTDDAPIWGQFGHDNLHTGRANNHGAQVGTLMWKFNAGCPVYGSPVVGADGTVYIGADNGMLYAIHGPTGMLLWSFQSEGAIRSAPAIGPGDTLFYGTQARYVYAVQAGALKWVFAAQNNITSSPALDTNGVLYIGSEDGCLYALDQNTGDIRWKACGQRGIQSSPAVVNGMVFFGSLDGSMWGATSNTGNLTWRFSTPQAIVSSPAIYKNLIYVASGDGSLYGVDMTKKVAVWTRPSSGKGFVASPSIGTYMYIGDMGGNFNAFDIDGLVRWTYRFDSYIESTAAVGYSGFVYAASGDGNVYRFDGKSGDVKWKHSTGGPIYSSPAIGYNSSVIVGSGDGFVWCFQ